MTPKKRFVPRAESKDASHFLEAETLARDPKAMMLAITAIKVGENVRSEFTDLEELVGSIRDHGILQPLLLSKTTRGLELCAGRRRLEAAKLAGLKDVPVRILGVDERGTQVVRLIENIQRVDLSGIDYVMAVKELSLVFEDQVQLAEALGKSKSLISRCLKLAAMIEKAKVSTSKLSNVPLSALLEIPYAKQPAQALEQAATGEAPKVREVRRQPSGPVGGGRYVGQAIQFQERKGGQAFSLRLNFDATVTPPATRAEIITRLEEILRRLRA